MMTIPEPPFPPRVLLAPPTLPLSAPPPPPPPVLVVPALASNDGGFGRPTYSPGNQQHRSGSGGSGIIVIAYPT